MPTGEKQRDVWTKRRENTAEMDAYRKKMSAVMKRAWKLRKAGKI